MLTLRTSHEFADWFAKLDQTTAESVAATLEVIAQLGPENDAPESTDWLTWYEHPSISERLHAHPLLRVGATGAFSAMAARFVREWGTFNGYARRVAKHLQSPAFTARWTQLDAKSAEAVSAALARIKRTVTRRTLAVSERNVIAFTKRTATPHEEAELFALADVREIREAYFAALAAAGFELTDLPSNGASLREIALRSPLPGLRLLYGMDPKSRRALVVLGEYFDRSFYGDSVRLAERKWREFVEDDDEDRASP